MEKYETKKLYVVRPSIVINDETIGIGYNGKKDIIKYKHIVEFENNSKDIDIAITYKNNISYNSLFNSKMYLDVIGNHCVEGDYHVGIYENDIVLLAKYLFMQSVLDTKWTRELEEYIISLKPYYDYDELKNIYEKIYEQISAQEESVKTKTLTNTYSY